MFFFLSSIIKLFVLLSIFILKKETDYAQEKLTTNKRIPANALVVEGWLPDYALPLVYDEYLKTNYDLIITTGLGFNSPLRLYTNSFLIFKPYQTIKSDTTICKHIIQISTESSLIHDDSCRFRLWINDKMVSTFFANNDSLNISYAWYGSLSSIDSILIQYDSDRVDERGDRNLIIHDLKINQQSLVFKNASIILDKGRPFGVNRRNLFARSYAELAANYFLDRGISEEKIIVVTNNSHSLNRTLGSALTLKRRINSLPGEIRGINVVSNDLHSTRSYLVYRKILQNECPVGIISIPISSQKYSEQETQRILIKESLAIMYYTLFIFPVIWIKQQFS